jgi:hypothetical protein
MKAMLLSKLKLVWAVALAAVVGAGAVGLTYRQAAAQPGPSNAPSRSARATADELEELRLEVAALRKGLEVTRERVKALEGEVRTLQGRAAVPMPDGRRLELSRDRNQMLDDRRLAPDGRRLDLSRDLEHVLDGRERLDAVLEPGRLIEPARKDHQARHAGDPLGDAEKALRHLRANPNDKQAADALERALKQLKGRADSPRKH